MRRNLFLLIFIYQFFSLNAQYPTGIAYIDRYKMIAISEMQRTGIPASIKLGQAILESGAGTSKLAEKANNHFGVKCGSIWNGDSYGLKDDERAFLVFKKKSCFRKYNNADESFIDHSEFIRRPNGPYQFLFSLDRKDYKGWAYGLKKAGYATADDYPQKLIKVIETYQLYQFDGNAPSNGPVVYNPEKPTPQPKVKLEKKPLFKTSAKPIRINMVKAYIAKGGENVEDIAKLYEIPMSFLIDYNERLKSPNQLLYPDEIVYLQKKKKSFWGKKKLHYVKSSETMFDISQQYGVREDKLRERNFLTAIGEPVTGQQIYLRGTRPKGDRLKTTILKKSDPVQIEDNTMPEVKKDNPVDKAKPVPIERDGSSSELLDFYVSPQSKMPDSIRLETQDSIRYKPVITGAVISSGIPIVKEEVKTSTIITDVQVKTDPIKPGANQTLYHVVDKGDTLYNISKRYGTTVAKIRELNQLAIDNIVLGQKLIIRYE